MVYVINVSEFVSFLVGLRTYQHPGTIVVCTVKSANNGQRNCPKHVEFYAKNKFENLVHLVGFIIRIYHNLFLE